MKKIFCIITICLSVTALADYYIYICPDSLCSYSSIRKVPGTMNCPICMNKNRSYKLMIGKKVEE
jgi:hypothetical protein